MSDTSNLRVEYRVRKVERYVVTRWHGGDKETGSEERGEFANADTAFEVAYALCKQEHDRLGYPLDDERIQYPRHPNEAEAQRLA